MLNLLLLLWRAVETIAGWWILFGLFLRPAGKARRFLLYGAFIAGYVLWYAVPLTDVQNVIAWDALILLFALITGKDLDELKAALFTAAFYIGVENCLDTLWYFLNIAVNGGVFRRSILSWDLQYLVLLGLVYFFYRIMSETSGRLSFRFWIVAALSPCLMAFLMTRFVNLYQQLLAARGANLYVDGLVFGASSLALCFSFFYLYARLCIVHSAQTLAAEVAHTPPVWTAEGGLSDAFCQEKGITSRQRAVVEALLRGKTDKEIAIELDLSIQTVRNVLARIYKHTGAHGRHALISLIRQGPVNGEA